MFDTNLFKQVNTVSGNIPVLKVDKALIIASHTELNLPVISEQTAQNNKLRSSTSYFLPKISKIETSYCPNTDYMWDAIARGLMNKNYPENCFAIKALITPYYYLENDLHFSPPQIGKVLIKQLGDYMSSLFIYNGEITVGTPVLGLGVQIDASTRI